MSNELMPALSGEVERNDRYNTPPSLFTPAGQLDRRHEAQHVVAIRDSERQAREQVAAAAVEAVADIAWIEARAKVNTEAKYTLERARRESQVLAGDDAELRSKFVLMDDDNFQEVRRVANRPRSAGGRLFG
jgi:hypothetical protein